MVVLSYESTCYSFTLFLAWHGIVCQCALCLFTKMQISLSRSLIVFRSCFARCFAPSLNQFFLRESFTKSIHSDIVIVSIFQADLYVDVRELMQVAKVIYIYASRVYFVSASCLIAWLFVRCYTVVLKSRVSVSCFHVRVWRHDLPKWSDPSPVLWDGPSAPGVGLYDSSCFCRKIGVCSISDIYAQREKSALLFFARFSILLQCGLFGISV